MRGNQSVGEGDNRFDGLIHRGFGLIADKTHLGDIFAIQENFEDLIIFH